MPQSVMFTESGIEVVMDNSGTARAAVGAKGDAAATGAVTTTDTLMAYVKQLVTQMGVEADTDPVSAILSGAGGITTWKSSAAPGTGISISEVLRAVYDHVSGVDSAANVLGADDSDNGFSSSNVTANVDGSVLERLESLHQRLPQVVSKAYADLTGYDTAAAFTVTGDVMVNVFGVVGNTAITSTSGTTTLSVGTTESAQSILANSTVDNSQFDATDVWVDSSPAADSESLARRWVVIGGGADIILTRSADDLTAGNLTLYCEWVPLSAGATIVAA